MLNSIYLLTGAAGFLGSNISRVLLEKGKKVRALVLNGDPAVKYVPEGVEIVYGDLTDKGTLEAFFNVPGRHGADCDSLCKYGLPEICRKPESI